MRFIKGGPLPPSPLPYSEAAAPVQAPPAAAGAAALQGRPKPVKQRAAKRAAPSGAGTQQGQAV